MKRYRKRDDSYFLPKRNATSSYQVFNGAPYQPQNNPNYSPVPQHVSHNQMHFGTPTPNGYPYHMGNGWTMQPPGQFPMPSYVPQTHVQYPQMINCPGTNQTSPTQYSNVSNFSVPTPPYLGQNGYHQPSNSVPIGSRAHQEAPKRKWSRNDAIRALDLEEELCKRNTAAPYLVIRFPDPPLDTEMVKGYSSEIEAVHFQKNSAPRFCFVRLKDNADATKVIEDISRIPFGMGNLSAELRFDPAKPPPSTKPEQVDPYTLYVGNLSLSVSVETIKRHFPGASRYDLAFKSKIKPIRYAFIRFESVEKAIAAFKKGMNLQVEGRSLVLRFRRAKFNYPSDNATSSSKHLSNDVNLTDCDTVNDNSVIENPKETAKQIDSCRNGEVLVKNESREDANIGDMVDHIKEENYDSEFSYEDECSSSYCGYSHNDTDQAVIKSEMDDFGPCDSNCSVPVEFDRDVPCDTWDCAKKYAKCPSSSSTLGSYAPSSKRSEPLESRVNIVDAQICNPLQNKDNLKCTQATRTLSPRVSLSEKKYIENLYDQLNSSKVLKREGDFDEIEEMLKEVE